MALDIVARSANGTTLSVETLFRGGRLCLDFVNTFCLRRGVELEFLSDGLALRRWLAWAQYAGYPGLANGINEWTEEYAADRLNKALKLRGAIRELVTSVVDKSALPIEASEIVNLNIRANPTYRQLTIIDGKFREISVEEIGIDRWLTVVALDAVDLLCHSDTALLRQCECPTCVRFYYDNTKNHKRRWCTEKCGSAPKAAAYYRRKVARANRCDLT